MKVRIYLDARGNWRIESKRWYSLRWEFHTDFGGETAYERAKTYAQALKNPKFEEIQ